MMRAKVLAVLVPLAIVAVVVNAARAERKIVKLEKEWKGSVDDQTLAKDSPAVIGEAKALEKLYALDLSQFYAVHYHLSSTPIGSCVALDSI
jgi:hypothetical protein